MTKSENLNGHMISNWFIFAVNGDKKVLTNLPSTLINRSGTNQSEEKSVDDITFNTIELIKIIYMKVSLKSTIIFIWLPYDLLSR